MATPTISWIQSFKVKGSREKKKLIQNAMKINCEFGFFSENMYTCRVTETCIIEKNHVIKKFKGIHKAWKNHKDVEVVWFNQTNLNHFPRGLQKHFPNLTQLFIFGGDIKEVTKSDLKGLEGLTDLYIRNCELTSLPDDLFTEMPKLREVNFYGNQIEFASSNLLKPLIGRENVVVSLQRNKNIDAQFWPENKNLFGSTKSLEDLMKLIDEKCIKPIVIPDPLDGNQLIKEMWISGKFSDLTIVAGKKKFKVHKNILGLKSQVFGQIFEDQNEATEIKIPDFSANSVEALLKFIYTNEASEVGNAMENFDIAHKFKIPEMKSIYEKVIGDQINKANAWEIFMFAHRFSSQPIKNKAFQQIVEDMPDKVPGELMEDPETLKKLIDHRRAYEEILILPRSKKIKLTR